MDQDEEDKTSYKVVGSTSERRWQQQIKPFTHYFSSKTEKA